MSLLSTSHLNVKIGGTQVCDDLNLHCKATEVWGILGRNGKVKLRCYITWPAYLHLRRVKFLYSNKISKRLVVEK